MDLDRLVEDYVQLIETKSKIDNQLEDVKASFLAEARKQPVADGTKATWRYEHPALGTISLTEYEAAPPFDFERFKETVDEETFYLVCEPKGWRFNEKRLAEACLDHEFAEIVRQCLGDATSRVRLGFVGN